MLLLFTGYLGCSVGLRRLCTAQRCPVEGPDDTGNPTCMLIPELCDGAEGVPFTWSQGHPVLVQIKVLHGLVAACLFQRYKTN